ncbi:hypothetical protein PV416_40865 [Streptomyces ipomoeae]|jgi:hypothetical protein|uniref:hypothetical protein n=1 Tax=Streptomyces ipomoeae TaxID=103232 RepID=UPI0029A1A093|nr:hypothetical protein [Streptomyces ipomoeae]MDX2827243.1 hypothetical protein [Streptomyces ipomoeae]MDX2875213.1 hypothetical protein [Streptomyces ipomoeae]
MNDVYAYRAPEEDGGGGDGGRGGRRWWLVTGVAVGVLALSGVVTAAGWLLVGQGGDSAGGRAAEQAADARWAEGVTPEWMSEQMGLDVPVTARSPQAAYEVTSRFDTGLLTFTLTRSEAEAYLKEHPPEGKWLEPTSAQADVAPHDFAHLGLPEPETFKDGMRYGYVCPGAAETTEAPGASGTPDDPFGMSDAYDTSDESCVRLYAHEYSPNRTRIYLRAHFEPGISPLPATPSSSTSTSTSESESASAR